MATRYYSNAAATALSGGCTALDTTITVDSVTGLPIQYPFVMILDRGTGFEEVVLVTNASGNDLTVSRGYDSTTAFAHSLGAEAVHGVAAIDHREANAHVNATSGVHGLAGDLVGTTDTQTVTNKDLSSGTNTFPSSLATEVEVDSAISDAMTAHEADTTTHGTTGNIVGTSDTQTLTGKTISADDNTINGLAASSFAQTDATGKLDGSAAAKAIPAGAVVGTTDAQTLTNKSLTSPTITGVGQVLRAYKTTSETVVSSTSLQDDDELFVNIPAAGTYIITIRLILDLDGAGALGHQMGLDFSGTVTSIDYSVVAATAGGISPTNTTMTVEVANAVNTVIEVGCGTVNTGAHLFGSLVAGDAGTLNFRWAQNQGHANGSVVRAGSWMRVERVA